MEDGYTSLPSSHLLGSVSAVISEEQRSTTTESGASKANLKVFPPNNNGGGSQWPPSSPTDEGGQSSTTSSSSWKGVLSIESYRPYFDVDTDVVVDRLVSSVYPMDGFGRKIDGNPDMYGPVWIITTLVFVLAAFGNMATYLIHQRNEQDIAWNFDVTYVNWAASVLYGYAVIVPAAFYFLLRYFGSNASLIRLWCMWGYSLFVFVPSSLLLVIPVEALRWIIISLAGAASSWFVFLNLKTYTEGNNDHMVLVASASLLQLALAIFMKVFFFA